MHSFAKYVENRIRNLIMSKNEKIWYYYVCWVMGGDIYLDYNRIKEHKDINYKEIRNVILYCTIGYLFMLVQQLFYNCIV